MLEIDTIAPSEPYVAPQVAASEEVVEVTLGSSTYHSADGRHKWT